MKHSLAQKSVTLSALFDILPPDTWLSIMHRLGPHECEAATVGPVRWLRDSRCMEVYGLNVVERVISDDPITGMMTVTVGGKEP